MTNADNHIGIKKALCSKRWNFPSINLSTRMVRTCCRAYGPVVSKDDLKKMGTSVFLNHPYMQEGRRLMLEGMYQEDCKGCYFADDSGANGFRTPFNESVKDLSTAYKTSSQDFLENIVKKDTEQYLKTSSAKELEVNLGNLCDLMCIYCDGNYSSRIEAEEKKHNLHTTDDRINSSIDENSDLVKNFWQWLEEEGIHDLHCIHLLGGEPLFNSYIYTFFEKLNDIYVRQKITQRISINIFSNLNNETSIKKFLQAVFSLNKNIEIVIYFSNEAYGKRSEIIRYGLNWDRAVQNINSIIDCKKVRLAFAPTFNLLSLSSTLDYFKFIQTLRGKVEYDFCIGDNIVSSPEWQSPFILTPFYTDYVSQVLDFLINEGPKFIESNPLSRLIDAFKSLELFLKNDVHNNSEDIQKKRVDFLINIKRLEEKRNINILETFPEYDSFFKVCQSVQS